jgi:uroporphyrinogen decarboxylase
MYSPRERVIKALNHEEPDRVPVDLSGSRPVSIYSEVYYGLMNLLRLDVDPSTHFNYRGEVFDIDERLLEALQVDFRRIRLRPSSHASNTSGSAVKLVDEWGIEWRHMQPFWSPVGFPLEGASIEDLEAYSWPSPLDPAMYEGVADQAAHLYKTSPYALVAAQPTPAYGVFTTAQFLRGPAQFLLDLALDPDFALALLEKVLQYHLGIYGHMLDLIGNYVQMVQLSDDLGTQQGPLISPDMYSHLIKPFIQRLINLVHSKTKAKIFFHSDGGIQPFIQDLIDMGVEVLNPVQPMAAGMSSEDLKAHFGDRLCFHGGIDTQSVLSQGASEQVIEEVRRRIGALGVGGGYILAPVHNLLPGIPPENVRTMFQAALEYGRYPLRMNQ